MALALLSQHRRVDSPKENSERALGIHRQSFMRPVGIRGRELPDLLAVNKELAGTNGDSASARGGEWVLLTPHRGGERALVIGCGNITALHVLGGLYKNVSIWLNASRVTAAWSSTRR